MNILHNIFIQPLIFIYDLLFTLISRSFQNPVSAIIALSVIVSFLVLPLYRKADNLQREEQQKKVKMKPVVDHIKKVFVTMSVL